jgi:hypothetical protein
MSLTASEYFTICAKPLYERYLAAPESDLRWAAVVAVHHVVDYSVLEDNPARSRNELENAAKDFREKFNLEELRKIADTLKHGVKFEKKIKISSAASVSDDFFNVPDVFVEPDIFQTGTIEIEGQCVSINVALNAAVEFWSNRFQTKE